MFPGRRNRQDREGAPDGPAPTRQPRLHMKIWGGFVAAHFGPMNRMPGKRSKMVPGHAATSGASPYFMTVRSGIACNRLIRIGNSVAYAYGPKRTFVGNGALRSSISLLSVRTPPDSLTARVFGTTI